MALYLLGRLSEPRPRPTKHIPVGIVVRDGEEVEVRTVPLEQIPIEYIAPDGSIFDDILKNLDTVFRNRRQVSNYDTSLTFYEIEDVDESGTLKERADRLFKRDVLPSYKKD